MTSAGWPASPHPAQAAPTTRAPARRSRRRGVAAMSRPLTTTCGRRAPSVPPPTWPPGPACRRGATPAPDPAGMSAYFVRLQAHRKAKLQDFGVGESRVGHVGLHGVASVEIGARAGTSCDCLVILQAVVAESQIVHCALGGREYPQRSIQRIYDALGGFHVSGRHRSRGRGVQH